MQIDFADGLTHGIQPPVGGKLFKIKIKSPSECVYFEINSVKFPREACKKNYAAATFVHLYIYLKKEAGHRSASPYCNVSFKTCYLFFRPKPIFSGFLVVDTWCMTFRVCSNCLSSRFTS